MRPVNALRLEFLTRVGITGLENLDATGAD